MNAAIGRNGVDSHAWSLFPNRKSPKVPSREDASSQYVAKKGQVDLKTLREAASAEYVWGLRAYGGAGSSDVLNFGLVKTTERQQSGLRH